MRELTTLNQFMSIPIMLVILFFIKGSILHNTIAATIIMVETIVRIGPIPCKQWLSQERHMWIAVISIHSIF